MRGESARSDGWVTAYIGLGSNLDRPVAQIERAFDELAELPDCRHLRRSPLYRSAPMGPQDQPDYVNAVAGIETRLQPHALLAALQAIEQRHHRLRGRRWGARTLDLDLLLYADRVVSSADLRVPHPGLPARAFVLYPLRDIAPNAWVPGHGPVSRLAAACDGQGVRRMEGPSPGVTAGPAGN